MKRKAEWAASSRKIIADIELEVRCRASIEGARPRSFSLGSRFAETLLVLPDRQRRKAIRAIADLVVGSPASLCARRDHPHRAGAASTAPPIIRAADGAIARRCSIERNIPAALRLLYWVLPGGALELAAVKNHDEMDVST